MERFRLLRPHLEQNEPLTSVAKAAGISYRTDDQAISRGFHNDFDHLL